MSLINARFTSDFSSNTYGDCCTLLKYLELRFTYKQKEEWRDVICKKKILIDDQIVTNPEYLLNDADQVTFLVENYFEPNISTDFEILKKTQGLLFVHKSADLPVHRTGKIFFNTLVNLLRISENNININPINRLDRETSGVLVFSEESKVISTYGQFVKGVRWEKLYVAIVPKNLLGRSIDQEGIWKSSLDVKEGSKIRCKMYVELEKKSKTAITYYKIIPTKNDYQLVLLSPITGRKHQLRAHLSHYYSPVVGDKIYSQEGIYFLKRLTEELNHIDFQILGAKHHLLHCCYTAIYKGNVLVEDCEDFLFPHEWEKYITITETQDLIQKYKEDILCKLNRLFC